MLLLAVCVYPQQSRTIETDNYVTEAFSGVYIEMPDYREINSGTKLIVSYHAESTFPAEMMGAFDYAVRLWEEVLPTSLPIKIKVDIKPLRKRNVISEVRGLSFDCEGERDLQYSSPTTLIKNVYLKEYHKGMHNRFYYDIEIDTLMKLDDIVITYNEQMLSQFSYSLDGEYNSSKYDFVTVALRDIALGLGFTTPFVADTDKEEFIFTGARLTPFESRVMSALSSHDKKVAYANATKGCLPLSVYGQANERYDMTMYAPETWINGVSLHYFISGTNPITKLLTHDFGKGHIIRDLTGIDWEDFFYGALDWRADIVVGASSNISAQTGSSYNILPYKGSVSFEFAPNEVSNLIERERSMNQSDQFVSDYSTSKSNRIAGSDNLWKVNTFCRKFDFFSPDGPEDGMISLSVLMNDGTWKCLYKTYLQDVTINIESLDAQVGNHDSLARGTTGGLRYRITQCRQMHSSISAPYYVYNVKYFTRDFIPQKATISYTDSYGIQSQSKIADNSDDDFFVDVPIGIANVEGTKRVVVRQLDEGEYFPFDYEVTDFRNGYFMANLDKELSTQLTVISYNENGYSKSNTITIPPLGQSAVSVSIKVTQSNLIIEGFSNERINSGKMTYELHNLSNLISPVKKATLNSNAIDISGLKKGIYVISLYNEDGIVDKFKFNK